MALAGHHETGEYLRLGVTAGVREEAFFLSPEDSDMAGDSIYGTVAAWAEISKVRFQQLRRFNGFGTEDLDLSPMARLTATLAPDAFGWQGTGFGMGLNAAGGRTGLNGRGWAWTSIQGNYQWGGCRGGLRPRRLQSGCWLQAGRTTLHGRAGAIRKTVEPETGR